MTVRFVSVGDVLVDVVATGREHDARVRVSAGGSGSNAAVAAVRAGAEVELFGRVGDDAGGRMVRAELAASGVTASLSVDPERPTGTFLLVDGEIRADRGANAGLLPAHLPETLDADAVLVSGHLPGAVVAAALSRSRAPWAALAAARSTQLPSGANAVFANEEEAHALTGAKAAEAARMLAERYRLVCVTLGDKGAIGVLDGDVEEVPLVARVASDAVGAGDALAAAVLVALASGRALREALDAGCRAGALALSGPK